MRLHSKIGIVTGGGSGIGAAGVLRFSAEGAAIGVVDIDPAKAGAVVSRIEEAGGRAIALCGDLADENFARSIVARTVDAFGGIDFVWNHAGSVGPTSIEGVDLAALESTISLNLRAGILATEAAIPHLRPRRGNVLFTSSTSGVQGSRLSFAYSMTKFGIVGMVRALAKRYFDEGIRFNAICPGPVETAMSADPVSRNAILQRTSRLGKPEEIAAAALFLVSDEASFVTGIAMVVDGGFTA